MKVLRCFLLGVLLAAGTSLAVDVNWLTGIVKAIREEYKLQGHFCMAAAIPLEQDANTLAADVLHDVRFNEGMEDDIKGGVVLEGNRAILAAPVEEEHAEFSVLKKLNKLNKYKSDFLLIYSYLSPCSKCTNWEDRHTILKQINNNIKHWRHGAFVFTKVYDKRKDNSTVPTNDVKTALNELADSMGGLQYIFRCDGPNISDLVCQSCKKRISDFCIDNNAPPDQSGSSGSERSQSESRSSSEGRRSRSSSRGGNRWGSRSSSESRASRRNRGGGSSRKRHIYRSQSEGSISSSESSSSSRNSRKVGKNKGGGSMSRKRGKYGSQNESRSSSSSG